MRSFTRSLLRCVVAGRAPRRSMPDDVTPWWLPTRASRVRTRYRASAAEPHGAPLDGVPLVGDPADGLDQHHPLGGLDPLVQRLRGVVLEHRDGGLGDDRSAVDTRVD